jgi:hypothetical protein
MVRFQVICSRFGGNCGGKMPEMNRKFTVPENVAKRWLIGMNKADFKILLKTRKKVSEDTTTTTTTSTTTTTTAFQEDFFAEFY